MSQSYRTGKVGNDSERADNGKGEGGRKETRHEEKGVEYVRSKNWAVSRRNHTGTVGHHLYI